MDEEKPIKVPCPDCGEIHENDHLVFNKKCPHTGNYIIAKRSNDDKWEIKTLEPTKKGLSSITGSLTVFTGTHLVSTSSAKISTSWQANVCSKCKRLIPTDCFYCPNCGFHLIESSP